MWLRLSESPLAHSGHSSLIQPQRPLGGDGPSRMSQCFAASAQSSEQSGEE